MGRFKRLVIVLAVVVGGFVLLGLALPGLGYFLAAEDEPVPSDLIVVLMGSGPDRMLGAVGLYAEGYADGMVMVRNKVPGYDLVRSRGVEIPHDVDIARDVAVQLGVPAEKIRILPGDALSTQDEAVQVREFLRGETEIDSLIIVTSAYHSKRSKRIFEKVLGTLDREVRVISCPTPYDDFNAAGWWRDREDLKRGVMEYLKLGHFYLREQFRLQTMPQGRG